MYTRHPITGEWCELTNREARAIARMVPTDCSLWGLLCAECDFDAILTVIAERRFDSVTKSWLVELLCNWKGNVLASPAIAHQWYLYVCTYHNLDNIGENLNRVAEMRAKLARLQMRRNKDAMRMMKLMRKQIDNLKKMQMRKKKRSRR